MLESMAREGRLTPGPFLRLKARRCRGLPTSGPVILLQRGERLSRNAAAPEFRLTELMAHGRFPS